MTVRKPARKSCFCSFIICHIEGVEEVEEMIACWKKLAGKVEERTFENVSERFARQLENAREWRDQVNTCFYRKCGIPDEKGRQIY